MRIVYKEEILTKEIPEKKRILFIDLFYVNKSGMNIFDHQKRDK
jgi:hypothetical protein